MIEKILFRALLIAAAAAFGYFAWSHYQAQLTELRQLRQYKTSVEARQRVSDVTLDSYARQKEQAKAQEQTQKQRRTSINNVTTQIAHEDQATADFLAVPIPRRLRDADREASEPRGLDAGEYPAGESGPADAGSR